MLETFSSINYMSGKTSFTCSKGRPSRLGVSDFVCLTPQGLLTILAYGVCVCGGGGVRMKDQIQTQKYGSSELCF